MKDCVTRKTLRIGMTNAKRVRLLGAVLATAASLGAQTQSKPAQQELPNAPGKQTVQKVCGSCHSASIVLGRGMTHEEWSEVVAGMISRGAKGTQNEFSQVVDYLASNLPPKKAAAGAAAPRRKGGGGFTVGPDDKQIVDVEAADRGRKTYNARCVACHGPKARGTGEGSDLVRSLTILHDRYGNEIGPFLRKGHPKQSSTTSASLTKTQIADLSHFLHQQLNDTLRSGPYSKVLNVLTGDPKAGAAYFNGAGTCSTCHSPTGDLAGIASKYDPPTLQQRFLFPRMIGFGRRSIAVSKPVTVTVTPAGEPAVSGVLDKIDDFSVSLRDASGEYHSWKRTPDLKVEKNDPYAAHIELLDKYTDKDIHDVVAYLETMK
jgi:cytochrome c oxidase cbb3-type subunit III